MSARQHILDRIREARTQAHLTARPHPGAYAIPALSDPLAQFVDVATAGGSGVVRVSRDRLDETVRSMHPDVRSLWSMVADVPGATPLSDQPRHAADLELFVVEGLLGVAESGAVWLPIAHPGARAALFLAEHVVIVLNAGQVVGTMHEAYATVDVANTPFGCFVAGPSKTADIEQSLVVGAHGPTGLTLMLVE